MICPLCRKPEVGLTGPMCVACVRHMCLAHLDDKSMCYECAGVKEREPVVDLD